MKRSVIEENSMKQYLLFQSSRRKMIQQVNKNTSITNKDQKYLKKLRSRWKISIFLMMGTGTKVFGGMLVFFTALILLNAIGWMDNGLSLFEATTTILYVEVLALFVLTIVLGRRTYTLARNIMNQESKLSFEDGELSLKSKSSDLKIQKDSILNIIETPYGFLLISTSISLIGIKGKENYEKNKELVLGLIEEANHIYMFDK